MTEELTRWRLALEQIASGLGPDESVDLPGRRDLAWAVRIARSALGDSKRWPDPVRLPQSPAAPQTVPAHQVSAYLASGDEFIIVTETPHGKAVDPLGGRPGGDQIHLGVSPALRADGFEPRAYLIPPDARGYEYLVAGIARWHFQFCEDPVFCFRRLVPPMWRWGAADSHWYPGRTDEVVSGLESALDREWARVADAPETLELFEVRDKLPRLDLMFATQIVDVKDRGVRPIDVAPIIGNNRALMSYPKHWSIYNKATPVPVRLSNDVLVILDAPRVGDRERKLAWFFHRVSGQYWDLLDRRVPEHASLINEWKTLARLSR